MKKTIAYMTAAILLGAITILLPLKLIPSLPSPSFVRGEDSNYLPSPCLTESQGAKTVEEVERLWGLYHGPEAQSTATFPSSLFHIGVVLSFGLIFAAGVTLFLKRRLF
mgnify:CR=1 FL=1